MGKTEEYRAAIARNRHPTFLQDLIEKPKKKQEKVVLRKPIKANGVITPNTKIEFSAEQDILLKQKEILKKIW